MKYKPFHQLQSRAIRLWHWLSFITVLLILYTVFTGKFFLNPFGNSFIIHDILQQSGNIPDPDPSRSIADALSRKVWDWHVRYGYALIGLFLFRILAEIFSKREERFFHRFGLALRRAKTGPDLRPAQHYVTIRILYILFYLLLAMITGTGLWLSFHRQPDELAKVHSIKEIHETCFYFLFLFIIIHITGVVLAERKKYKNIVSGMIHGGKEIEGE